MTDAGTPIILYGRLYTKYQFAISEVDTFAFPRNGAVYSQGNEVIVPASGETAEDIARASAVEKSGVLLGGDLNILRPFDFINPLFLALAISNGEPQKELAKKAQGKSVVHIHNTDIQEVTIAYPSRTEQDRIVSVFRQLDNLITLHQRQPFLLSTPDISLSVRLIHPFYTSSWEQRKAKELFVSAADKGYPELPVLSATQDRGMIRRDENSINIFHDKKNEAGYKRVLPGQFVIHLRSFQGGFAHSAIEGITSPAYTVFGFSEPEKHDSEYWKYVFTSKSFIQRLVTVTYGIRDGRSISYEEFLTLGFVYPSKAEQTAIARYLDKLSDLITLHQRKGKAAVSGCFLNCFSLEKSSAQSRTLELFGQISNQEIKYIIDGLSILGGKLRNFCVKLIILLSYTRINDIAKYHISRNTECVHNIN